MVRIDRLDDRFALLLSPAGAATLAEWWTIGDLVRSRAREHPDRPGIVDPTIGIPAALGVNFGDQLSYCWDTTECRLLYAWNGGFLDMANNLADVEVHGHSCGWLPLKWHATAWFF